MSEATHEAALVALLNTGYATAYAYTTDALSKLTTSPTSYAEVMVMERPTEGFRLGGRPDKRAWRVLVRAVATTPNNAKEMRRRALLALEDKWLTIDAVETTPIEHPVADDPIGKDADTSSTWYSGVSEFSYYA